MLRLRRFDASGLSPPGTVAIEKGFEVGKMIQRRGDKVTAVIDSYQGDSVIVSMQEGPLSGKAKFPIEVLVGGKWKVIEPKGQPTMITDLMKVTPNSCAEMAIQTLKGKVISELWHLEQKHQKVHQSLNVQLKPHKGVYVTKAFGKEKLVLTPCSWKVEGRPVGDPLNDQTRGLCLGQLSLSGHAKSYVFHIHPSYNPEDKNDPFVNPCFFVRSTTEESDANMEIHPKLTPSDKNHQMKIPVLRNTKPLDDQDELLVYIPAKAVVEEIQAYQSPPKRHRTKGPQP